VIYGGVVERLLWPSNIWRTTMTKFLTKFLVALTIGAGLLTAPGAPSIDSASARNRSEINNTGNGNIFDVDQRRGRGGRRGGRNLSEINNTGDGNIFDVDQRGGRGGRRGGRCRNSSEINNTGDGNIFGVGQRC
jgi:hypothetical protein